jgi:hypothetical protein
MKLKRLSRCPIALLSAGLEAPPPKGVKPFGCEAMTGAKAAKLVVESHHEGKLPLAYPRRVFSDGIEHWLGIVW